MTLPGHEVPFLQVGELHLPLRLSNNRSGGALVQRATARRIFLRATRTHVSTLKIVARPNARRDWGHPGTKPPHSA
jgi:hypothetical protein